MEGFNTLTALEWVKKYRATIECQPDGFRVVIYVGEVRLSALRANLVAAVFQIDSDLTPAERVLLGGTTSVEKKT